MSELDLSRTTRFVSLDTHPANNSLVVTYEIIVTVRDGAVAKDLCRRTKRDQFQIGLSVLNQFSDDSTNATAARGTFQEIVLELGKISEQILAKCPILADSNRAEMLEDIQLNLLYLVNRKQSQLSQPSRPSSSASLRLKSTSGRASARLVDQARHGSDRKEAGSHKSAATDNPMAVYQNFCEKELRMARRQDFLDYERVDLFVGHLDEHLAERESELHIDSTSRCQMEETLDAQLENLYGETDERCNTIAVISRMVRDDENLARLSSNRLLMCAMLRILRYSHGSDADRFMSESILYCLVRFTSYQDIFAASALGEGTLSGENESLDLVRVTLDLLDEHSAWLAAKCEQDLRPLTGSSYYTNALLVLLSNILRLDFSDNSVGHKIKQRILRQYGTKLANVLCVFSGLAAKHLVRDIRTSTRSHERLTASLIELFSIAEQFTVYRDFINLLKEASRIQPLVEALVAILNTLQLSRPGSGSNQLQQVPADDCASLFRVYALEIDLISTINNLVYDQRFRSKFTRKNLLLKCILRSLVVFLAGNRRLCTLNPFNGSLVLIAPLKCLYELSCSDAVKRDLFESRIIMRCLCEYLLASAAHLETEIETCRQRSSEAPGPGSFVGTGSLNLNDGDQILLRTRDACQYVVSLWLNLSNRPEAPFYKQDDEELPDLIKNYVELVISHVEAFLTLATSLQQRIHIRLVESLRKLHLMNYIHLKLVKNMSQFLCKSDCFKLAKLSAAVVVMSTNEQQNRSGVFVPLLAECLEIICNVVSSSSDDVVERHQSSLRSIIDSIFSKQHPLINGLPSTETESDDLLLVAVKFLGLSAQRSEICPLLKTVQENLLKTVNQILELRMTDLDMIISCLFALDQLTNHIEFLEHVGMSLDEESSDKRSSTASKLIDQLSSLVSHTHPSIVQLSDQVLNKVKQFEESQSLADSVTSRKRFASHNNKWLNAIRANREDASDSTERDLGFSIRHQNGLIRSLDVGLDNNDDEETDLDEYRHLRTINESSSRTCSGLTSGDSASRSSSRLVGAHRTGNTLDDLAAGEYDDEEELDADEDDDTFSEPDVNVIDPMSMIGHLTNKGLCGEITRR